MKKISAIFAGLFVLCSIIYPAFAEDNVILMKINTSKVYINGETVYIEDTVPTVINDRTMLPLRFLGEALDAEVSWIAETNTVVIIKNDRIIEIIANTPVYKIDGNLYESDTSAVVINGRTLVPVRIAVEALGMLVDWYDEGYVIISDVQQSNIVKQYCDEFFR